MEPVSHVTYALQTSLDRAIDQFESNLKKNAKLKKDDKKKWNAFVQLEENKIRTVAQIQSRLQDYRKSVDGMTERERRNEQHDSSRLGDHMRAEGLPRPNRHWHAHSMISGRDIRAALLRAKLAEISIGIDDPHNGCWLPSRTKYAGQPPYPKAVPHSRIHRNNYYFWLNNRFQGIRTQEQMIARLQLTRTNLQHSTFPPEVMLKAGEWKEPYDNIPTAQ